MRPIMVLLFGLVLLSTAFAVNVSTCAEGYINAPGTYTLNASVFGAPNSAAPSSGVSCIVINSSDVIFDLALQALVKKSRAKAAENAKVSVAATPRVKVLTKPESTAKPGTSRVTNPVPTAEKQ